MRVLRFAYTGKDRTGQTFTAHICGIFNRIAYGLGVPLTELPHVAGIDALSFDGRRTGSLAASPAAKRLLAVSSHR